MFFQQGELNVDVITGGLSVLVFTRSSGRQRLKTPETNQRVLTTPSLLKPNPAEGGPLTLKIKKEHESSTCSSLLHINPLSELESRRPACRSELAQEANSHREQSRRSAGMQAAHT